MKNGLKIAVFVAAMLLVGFSAGAEEMQNNAGGDDIAAKKNSKEQTIKHLTMEEIVISDEIITDTSTVVVGTKTIERGKNTTVPDALRYEPEIDIKRKALVGDSADTLSIRGLSGNRIMLNIDGRSVNAAGVQGGYFIDWGTIPLDNIEKIEVIKGGSSVKYGNNSGGGVINVITKKPTKKPTISFYGMYGTGEDLGYTQNYRLTHSYKIGPVGYSIGASYQRAAPYLWNNDYEAENLSSRFYFDMPLKGELSLGIQYTFVDRGFALNNRMSTNPTSLDFYTSRYDRYPLSFGDSFSPGAGNVTTPGPGAHWCKTKYLLDLGYKQHIGDLLVEFKAYQNVEDRRERNYSASWINSAYPNGRLVLDRTVKSDRTYGGSIEFSMPLGKHDLLGGIERKVIATGGQTVRYVDRNYGIRGDVSRSSGQSAYLWGYYLQDGWNITDHFLLTPGLRYDTYDAPQSGLSERLRIKEEGLSMSLAGTYKFTEKDALTVAVYRKYLTPSAPDAYWWYEGYSDGLYNTPLKLEKNNAVELSYKYNFTPKNHIGFSAYYYDIEDYIKRFSIPEGRGCYNIDEVKLAGISIDGAFEATKWLTVFGNLTYQKSQKDGDTRDTSGLTRELEYLPRWKANTGVDIKLPRNILFTIRERYVGKRSTVYSYSVKVGKTSQTKYLLMGLDPYFTTDIETKIPLTKHMELSFFAENLFSANYEEVFGYQMPGTIVGSAIKITF